MSKKPKVILCPYCGNTQTQPDDRCAGCGGYFDQLSLKVTQQHMGPWFIRDRHNPFRPGCTYDVLVKQIQKGKITATTIIRGPTTRQYWSVARHVPGVAHQLGYCHACGTHVQASDQTCSHCGESFFAPQLRDNLGLAPIDPQFMRQVEAMHAGQPIPGSTPQPTRADSGDSGGPAVDQPRPTLSGSAILRSLRDREQAEASGEAEAQTLGSGASRPRRDAMDWMAGRADEKPDDLESASQQLYGSSGGGLSGLTWLLIAMNALLFVGIIIAVIVVMAQADGDEPTQNQAPPTEPTEQPDPAAAGTPGDVTGSGAAASSVDTTPGQTDAQDAEASVAQAGQPESPPTAQPILPPANPGPSVWEQAHDRAAALEDAGQLDQALDLLMRIQDRAPADEKPASLDRDIQRLREKINRREVEAYFGFGEQRQTPLPGLKDRPGGELSPSDEPDNIFDFDDAVTDGQRQQGNWDSRFAEALDLESRQELRQALRIMVGLVDQAPTAEKRRELDAAIDRIRGKLDARDNSSATPGPVDA